MANRRRGEIEAVIDGRRHTLCLTLGGLAELESAFAVDNLASLGERFASGRLSAEDLVRILDIGLRGGGQAVTDAEIRVWPGGCLPEIAQAVAALLAETFGGAGPNPPEP